MTGVVQGVAQAATEITAAPLVSAGAMVMSASTMPAAAVASETVRGVTEGLDMVKSTVLSPEPLFGMPSVDVGNQLHDMVAKTGDYHGAMAQLAFGDMNEGFGTMSELGDGVQRDFQALEHMGPNQAGEVVQQAEGLQLPKDIVNDPQFLALFAEELGQDIAAQKSLLKEGKLSEEEYTAMRQSMLQRSAERAAGRREDSSVSENDLEELKRKAALEAIRQHMMLWRYSVMQDKRLTPEAKRLAIRRVDRLEQRLLVQEAIRWDGLSIMKMIALASSWMQEMADQ